MIVSFHSDVIRDTRLLRQLIDSSVHFINSRASYASPWIIDQVNELELPSRNPAYVQSVIGIEFKGLRYTKERKRFTYHPRRKGPSVFIIKSSDVSMSVYSPGSQTDRGMKFYNMLMSLYSGLSITDYKIINSQYDENGLSGTMELTENMWSYLNIIFRTLDIDEDGSFSVGQGEYMFNFASPDGNKILTLTREL